MEAPPWFGGAQEKCGRIIHEAFQWPGTRVTKLVRCKIGYKLMRAPTPAGGKNYNARIRKRGPAPNARLPL